MSVIVDPKKIHDIFDRGIVKEILPSREELFERFMSGKKLRVYIGADPTSDSLHLSHAKNYMFLEELRQLGHEVIVLVGDFTAKIGDPTGKNVTRTQLSDEQIKDHVRHWVSQIKPLMNFDDAVNPPRILYNSSWLAKLTLEDVISLSSNFTVQRMMERDMFEKRWEQDQPIYLHEFLYPLLQGYDSVAMDVDIELCGTDQIFNALTGRTLVKRLKNKDKFVIAVNLMENPKTGELMSKSKGTGVFLSSPPVEMFGAVMAQPDEMIEPLFVNCTRISLDELDAILEEGPRKAKERIAFEIVRNFYGEEKASFARDEFTRVFTDKNIPESIEEVSGSGASVIDFLVAWQEISKSEAKRLVDQKGVSVNDTIVEDWEQKLSTGDIIKVGSRKFARII